MDQCSRCAEASGTRHSSRHSALLLEWKCAQGTRESLNPLQANKRQKLLESEGPAANNDDSSQNDADEIDDASDGNASDASEDQEEQHQQAAGFSLDLGSAAGGDTKFRDENFYLGYDRGDNRYAEEGFAVGGRGEDMVLDLAGDENVSHQCLDPGVDRNGCRTF